MILVDTSIWVDHFRHGNAKLSDLLNGGQVLTHPFVIGELALGNLRQGQQIFELLQDLPSALVAQDDEVLHFISNHNLAGSGIGYIDAHLLASARLEAVPLWTNDKRLHDQAARLQLGAVEQHKLS